MSIRATVWNEHVHERTSEAVARVYPEGIHAEVAAGLREVLGDAVAVRTATLEEPDDGLAEDVLAATDVLVWWGHTAHDRVADATVERVVRRVLADGMGLVALHSAHLSRPFVRLMGTSCSLLWRQGEDRELVWVVDPAHPLADGLPPVFALPRHEMYGEFFDIPAPDALVTISSFSGGEVFRSACCFRRGRGRVAYLSPGHETYPIYRDRHVRRLVANAVRWAAPAAPPAVPTEPRNAPAGWLEEELA